MSRTTRYPRHLAKYVSARLVGENGRCPPETVLTTLFETLYFASLKTDEGRPCRFTLNYMDPRDETTGTDWTADRWTAVRFEQPLPFDVRTLAKLADAADPSVSSLAVFSDDRGDIFVWGLVDQELRYADYTSLDSGEIPRRPGLFQAKINGVGNVSAYQDYTLIGSLEHDTLVAQYHDVIRSGPIHELLKASMRSTYGSFTELDPSKGLSANHEIENELLTRSLNAICRILLNIQQYRHGGGVLITPDSTPRAANVKYKLHYDRLPKAIASFVRAQLTRKRLQRDIADHFRGRDRSALPRRLHEDHKTQRGQLETHKNEILGCVRFIASLSRVDGFVILDKSLVVHGFGVELRADSNLSEIWRARDSRAQPRLMKIGHLEEYGTRHRAMIRYCFEIPGTIGFVVSQDGDIRAMTRVGDKLVFWENVDVQLAFNVKNLFPAMPFTSFSTSVVQNEVA